MFKFLFGLVAIVGVTVVGAELCYSYDIAVIHKISVLRSGNISRAAAPEYPGQRF